MTGIIKVAGKDDITMLHMLKDIKENMNMRREITWVALFLDPLSYRASYMYVYMQYTHDVYVYIICKNLYFYISVYTYIKSMYSY